MKKIFAVLSTLATAIAFGQGTREEALVPTERVQVSYQCAGVEQLHRGVLWKLCADRS